MTNEAIDYILQFAEDFPKPFIACTILFTIPLGYFVLTTICAKPIKKIVEKAFLEELNKM